MLFKQLFDRESCTFTYLIAAGEGQPAIIIDPVKEHVDLYLKLIKDFQLNLLYSLETHTHADHVTGAGALAEACGCKIILCEQTEAHSPQLHKLKDGDRLSFGPLSIQLLCTPGHTDDSCCYVMEDRVFTGDTLLIRGSGRTDFQGGDAHKQYDNILNKLFSLPDETLVFPGHDYKVMCNSTIGEEKRFNPRLQVNNATEYAAIMDNLNLARPKKMDIAVPANLVFGSEES